MGHWLLVEWQGHGAFGGVYRALRTGHEHSGPVALKLSVYPWDARFAREVQVLSRLQHPAVPRLLDHGVLRLPSGAEHPYLVMDWVEGLSLYTWAELHSPSSPQLFRLLAQLARALAATHAALAVHRDVKGDNILVRLSDGHPFLIDFGSAHFQGASRLTWQSLHPFTPAYLSPAAWLFLINSEHSPDSHYEATPADDLYALGVTVYRLVMGEYPPPLQSYKGEDGSWHVTCPEPRLQLENNPHVDPRMRELILRLLSASPQARGSAVELAEALEAATDEGAPVRLPASPQVAQATEVTTPKAEAPSAGAPLPAHSPPRPRRLAWRPWLALATASGAALLLWALQASHLLSESSQGASACGAPEPGTTAVGDSSTTASPASAQPLPSQRPVAQHIPLKPRPGQLLPDEKGRCPGHTQVALNGGCWVEISPMTAEACTENGYAYSKGKCYGPALAPPKEPLPTSSPAEAR